MFDTDKWPLDSASLKLFENKEIKNLLYCYKDHNYLSEECANTAEREWPVFKTEEVSRKYALQYVYISPHHLYKGMIQIPSLLEEMGNMLTFVEIMMAISVTTATSERGFSSMNLEKTIQRTQIRPNTLDATLMINIDKTLEQFNPERALVLWLNDGPNHIDHRKLRKNWKRIE